MMNLLDDFNVNLSYEIFNEDVDVYCYYNDDSFYHCRLFKMKVMRH